MSQLTVTYGSVRLQDYSNFSEVTLRNIYIYIARLTICDTEWDLNKQNLKRSDVSNTHLGQTKRFRII